MELSIFWRPSCRAPMVADFLLERHCSRFKVNLNNSLLMASVMCLSIWAGFRLFAVVWRAIYGDNVRRPGIRILMSKTRALPWAIGTIAFAGLLHLYSPMSRSPITLTPKLEVRDQQEKLPRKTRSAQVWSRKSSRVPSSLLLPKEATTKLPRSFATTPAEASSSFRVTRPLSRKPNPTPFVSDCVV